MRKYGVMLLGLTVFGTSAQAMTANEQMEAMKGLYIKEFNMIDTNKDGVLSKDEYIAHQLESLRANLLSTSGAESTKALTSEITETSAKPELDIEMPDVPDALKAMAEFDIDLDDVDALTDISLDEKNTHLTNTEMESLKKLTNVEDLDLSVSEDDNLKNLLKEMEHEDTTSSQAGNISDAFNQQFTDAANDKDKQINLMMDTIRKTLPKKIDSITTWTDIEYKNSTISYIYKADIDTTKFSETEKASLELNIKNEACVKAYTEMCPRVKPMFINDGINVQIRYLDSNNKELSSCVFDRETCSD